jgi:hypothetical protein
MNNINFSEKYKIIEDLLDEDEKIINNKRKVIFSSLKSSLLSRVWFEREQLLQQDFINCVKLNYIVNYRHALADAVSERREICVINYL